MHLERKGRLRRVHQRRIVLILSNEILNPRCWNTPHALKLKLRIFKVTAQGFCHKGEIGSVNVSIESNTGADVTDSYTCAGDGTGNDWVIMPGEEVHVCQASASRLSPHGDPCWVSAEVDNVFKDPFHSETLVEHTEIGDVVQTSSIGVGEDVHTVVDSHHDVFLGIIDKVSGQLGGNVDTSSHVSAARREEENRKLGFASSVGGSPDCESQTVFR